ncbi:MAG: ABC transporter substrate-binding protein [Defluviicoccus sp.]|nr:ABC transporter substrate-binding protein [Defluviicoccus sp.]MDE0386496.1 ABC transporter substrate-binding protein [Defluviicoccus sp.]
MKFALTASCVAALAAALAAAGEARAQQTTKVKYAEVVRSVFYLPKYVAMSNGYFRDQGIEVDMTTAWGGDKGTAMLLSGKVDVVLQGPETAIYVENGASPEKTKMFAAITATDGLFLMSREKMTMEQFKWSMIKGKTVMGWRPGSTPGLFLEYAMKKHGISPKKDIDHVTNIAIPARVGAWMVNKASFSVFFEPDVSKLSRQGIAYPVASVGKEVGPVDYTVFMATDSYIEQNPKIIQGWANAIHKAQKWIQTADAETAAKAIAKWFPKVELGDIAASVTRYRKFGIWKTDPTTHPQAISALQDILVEGGVLKADKRVAYERVVTTKFSEAAKKSMQ